MATKLILVRHGETVDNEAHIMQGQTQGKLNANGIAQAEALSRELSHEHIDIFMASDLKRAIDTCDIIAKPHNKSVITTPLLRERDWGGFTGMYIPDLKDKTWPDDIESLEAMKQRATDFLQLITKKYHGKTVLAVGHGIINKAIQSVFFNKPMNEIMPMKNVEYRILELSASTE